MGALAVVAALAMASSAVAAEPVDPPVHEASTPLPAVDRRLFGFDLRAPGTVGVGAVVGTWVTGLDLRYVVHPRHTIGATLGAHTSPFPYGAATQAVFAVEWTVHPGIALSRRRVELGWFLGATPSAELGRDGTRLALAFGVRAVAGLDLRWTRVPIDLQLAYRPGLVFELRPALGLSYAYGDIGLAAHVHFR
ncbi:MAG: hypothetical protein RLZZ383_2012 [Pseudomonadota bacterium]